MGCTAKSALTFGAAGVLLGNLFSFIAMIGWFAYVWAFGVVG